MFIRRGAEEFLSAVSAKQKDHDEAVVKNVIGGDYQRIESVANTAIYGNAELLLLPVYVNTITFKNKSYTVFINGRTAEVEGNWAYSAVKELLFVLLALSVIIGIILLFAL